MSRERDELESMEPRRAMEMYFNYRGDDFSAKTTENYKYRIQSFVVWCEEVSNVGDMSELRGKHLYEWYEWRRDGSEYYNACAPVTLDGLVSAVNTWLEWAENYGCVQKGLSTKLFRPELSREDEVSGERLSVERAREIEKYLQKFRYASREHVIFAVLWHTGMRLGGLRALDADDFAWKENARDDEYPAYLDLVHRPETGTPLKNDEGGERRINVGRAYAKVIDDYVKQNRHDVTDKHGRRPLISSEQGRLSESPIRRICYQHTQPCELKECPHDEEPATCTWRQNRDEMAGCPSSRSPHAIRTGSISWHLQSGTSPDIVSERCDVSRDVLDKHYDMRSKHEKMETRRDHLEL